ncbi:YceI family protein [Spirosoma rhododendri]|uniref:YceI family protein n=1 Tax=Spirosoma rhododendri TaxID=2728024 RepID=A0A7L5DNG7_9BACT|nr:YceI family protein [Spirosoma rhododendri]QJD77300.1 YceI family protein [Spirosoma rhododendri]
MKTIACLSLFLISTLSAVAQRYVADSQQSKLSWTGHSEIGSYAPSGTVQLRQGLIQVRNGQISQARIDIDMRTIQHENGQMQTHLRGEDFFDTAKFPTATFTVQQISGGQASGLLTIKGVTKPISFPVMVTLSGDMIHLKGQASIDRTLFGVNYNSTSFFAGLGDHAIRNTFELTFDLLARRGNAVADR